MDKLEQRITKSMDDMRDTLQLVDKVINNKLVRLVNHSITIFSLVFLVVCLIALLKGMAGIALVAALVFFGIYTIRVVISYSISTLYSGYMKDYEKMKE